MRLIYKGEYNGDPETLPYNEHFSNAHRFDEISDLKKLSIIMNILYAIGAGFLFLVFVFVAGIRSFNLYAAFLSLLTLIPHEFIHACCFKEDVYLYTYLKKGMLFVTGTESMSKPRAIIMNLLPNIVFGFIPFALFLIDHDLTLLGSMSVFTICMGLGDYYNVINIIRQMPKGARTYLYKNSSYWYMPQ